ncbi:hypothetical protein [Ensifer sp. 1H6]|uniref:hypothetical protein n=1 Tax=Ensifer sp. 1H6 TaxID=1911585 RepID=UPI0009C8F48E|nr:hypothetical protein [Ensifer sp. 1H6]OMQ34826.1 hypothetical protein BKP54_32380 [Ensifer sp. 1H6]
MRSEEELFAPLLYSTELSRSTAGNTGVPVHTAVDNCWLATGENGPFVRLADARMVENLTYCLINIRTDGKTVAIAVLEETAKNPAFHVETFKPSELEEI